MRKLSFKWFGSLTNLSLRRCPEKSEPKSSQATCGAGCAAGDGTDCGAAATLSLLDPVAETAVDDMGAMRPRTASYVRSSESYTHLGTLPRILRRRRDQNSKGGPSSSKNSEDQSSIGRSQSQRPAGDRDRAPRRPTAASSKGSGDGPGARADTGLGKDSFTDPKTQPEPPRGTRVASTLSAMLPSGGSRVALQPETCEQNLNPEETSSPPPSRGEDETWTHDNDELESGPASDPKLEAESRQLTGENPNSDGIYSDLLQEDATNTLSERVLVTFKLSTNSELHLSQR